MNLTLKMTKPLKYETFEWLLSLNSSWFQKILVRNLLDDLDLS